MMKRTVKKSISLILAIAMVLTTVAAAPAVTFAANSSTARQSFAAYQTAAKVVASKAKKAKAKKKKIKNASKIPVLTYHRIITDKQKKSHVYAKDRYAISLTNFSKQMKWLKKKKYRAITCEELYQWRLGRIKLPKRSVLITIDDGHAASVENAIPVLSRYGLKATVFIIGKQSYYSNGSYYITYSRIQDIQKRYSNIIEFQSHTYDQHRPNAAQTESYPSVINDAAQQKNLYGFTYLAYPHGKISGEMIRAYQNSGIKMAFLFKNGTNGYATRKQNIYKMKRIEVPGNMKLGKFKRWCK